MGNGECDVFGSDLTDHLQPHQQQALGEGEVGDDGLVELGEGDDA